MSLTPFYVVCGLICLFWMFVHHMLAARQDSFGVLSLLLLTVFFAAAGDVLLGSLTGSITVSYMVVLLSAPAVIPLVCLYFAHISRPFHSRPIHFIWIVLPAVMFSACLIVTGLKGLDETDLLLSEIHSRVPFAPQRSFEGVDRVFYIWTVQVFRIVMIAETVNILVYCTVIIRRYHFKLSNVTAFLFKGRKIRVLELQMTLSLLILAGFSAKVFLHIPFFNLHPGLTISIVLLMGLLLFFFGLFALFGSRDYIALKDIPGALRYNYSRENQSAVTEEMVMELLEDLSGESLTHVISRMVMQSDTPSETVAARISGAPSLTSALFGNAKSWDEGSLVTRFQRLMVDEQMFLQPGLSLEDVAARLKSNKTYISKMVNQTYGIGFPEVLNILRVDYAQQYIRKHPDATQEVIARASGFVSAPSFNTVFKRITGYTPKVWASRNNHITKPNA